MADLATIENIPPEILSQIFSFLPPESLAAVCMVCKRFKEASQVESVWRIRCQSDYKVTTLNDDLTYYDVYTKILYHHGFSLGLWKANLEPYGGLLQVTFEGDKLVATEFRAPIDHIGEDPLRATVVFTAQIAPDGYAQVECQRGFQGKHECFTENLNNDGSVLSVECDKLSEHRDRNGEHSEFMAWLSAERSNLADMENEFDLLLNKFRAFKQYEELAEYKRLEIPPSRRNVPIQPGLFKGDYGAHGIEIIMVTYSEENNQMDAVKITGDPNIPAGEITIKADLVRPMLLQLNQQDSIETLCEIDIPDIPPNLKQDQLPNQPFRIPDGCYESHLSAPDRCKARFHSQGHIAGDGFENDEFIPGHWIVFNEDLFGHIWLELRSFSLFHRIKDL